MKRRRKEKMEKRREKGRKMKRRRRRMGKRRRRSSPSLLQLPSPRRRQWSKEGVQIKVRKGARSQS